MPAPIENYRHEIKQLPFSFPASRFSSTPQPWGATACTAGDFVEQMNNCGLICLGGREWGGGGGGVLGQLINKRLRSV